MSRFEINKFLTYTDSDGDRIAAFATNPRDLVSAWERRGQLATPRPVPDGGIFTGDERTALVEEDYGAIYAMGAHPYVLFHFAVAVDMVRGPTPWPDLVEWYRTMVRPHGSPDFTT